jgi:hypothetical protein
MSIPSLHSATRPMAAMGRKLTAQKTMAKPLAGMTGWPQSTIVFSMATWKTPMKPGAWGRTTASAMATPTKQAAPKGSWNSKAWKRHQMASAPSNHSHTLSRAACQRPRLSRALARPATKPSKRSRKRSRMGGGAIATMRAKIARAERSAVARAKNTPIRTMAMPPRALP